MSTKFFVYADGRWCELDAASGRVIGWRETARFVYVRRGKLHVARSSAVLRGLRALAAGQHSSVRESLALSIKRHDQVNVKKKKKDLKSSCQHSHCCCTSHHAHNIRKSSISFDKVPSVKIIPLELASVKTVSTNTVSKSDACIQVTDANKPESVDTIVVTAKIRTRNRKLEIENDERHIGSKRAKIYDENVSKDGLNNLQKTNRQKKTSKTKIFRKESDLSEGSDKIIPLTRSCLKNRLKRNNKKHRDKVFRELVIYEDDVLLFREFLARNNTDVDLYRFDTDEEYKAKIFYTINPLVNVERCARIKQMLNDNASAQNEELTLKDFAVKLGLKSVNDVIEKKRYKTRNSVAGNQKKVETDDKSDNPTEDLQSDEADKENSRVSLRSANKNIRQKVLNNIEDVFKNTSKKISNAKDASGKDKESSTDKAEKPDRVRTKETTSATHKSSSDSGKASLPSDKSADSKKSARPRFKVPKRSSVAGGREYSNLEDHAIVAWVSVGGRPRLVKGNRLWRELQTEYYRLTGQSRSWHSLRNRYLRYILPALSSLALPPSHAARLRAAADVGELKSRGKSPNPSSPPRLPAAPVGAWARRPRPAASPSPGGRADATGSGDLGKKVVSPSRVTRLQEAAARSAQAAGTQREGPSPTYAQVTRAFAARHGSPPAPPAPAPAPPAAPAPAPAPPARKTRRLYNPNARAP